MTGPEHFHESERLLEEANVISLSEPERSSRIVAAAQVHATLALVADPVSRITRAIDEINMLEHGGLIDTYAADRLREALGDTGGDR